MKPFVLLLPSPLVSKLEADLWEFAEEVKGETMKIILEDDCGGRKEFVPDPLKPFCPSEHVVQCACCRSWVLDEAAFEDDRMHLWFCSKDCQSEYRQQRREFYYGG